MSFLRSYFAPRKGQERKDQSRIDQRVPATPSNVFSFSDKRHTPWSTRPQSIRSVGVQDEELSELKAEVTANYLYQEQSRRLWHSGGYDEGVVVKKNPAAYICYPPSLADSQDGFMAAVKAMNVKCAITVNTDVVRMFLLNNPHEYVPLDNGLRLQILPDMSHLAGCQKHHFAAFIADRGVLVVWDDLPKNLLNRVTQIDSALMKRIWHNQSNEEDEKDKTEAHTTGNEVASDIESLGGSSRKTVYNQAFLSAVTLFIGIIAFGASFRMIALEIYVEHTYIRCALLLVMPIQFWTALFFFQSVVTSVAQLLGPVNQLNANTKQYSGSPPIKLHIDHVGQLPHVTIQCPVYKEGLTTVIEPTIRSLKSAISTYEMQGGTANIFINDDGMQLLDEEEACARQIFYDENNIGWVARPAHDPSGAFGLPFVRPGKFKKASNMNYGLWVSNRIEDRLVTVHRSASWTQTDEASAYQRALFDVVEEDGGRTWTDGNIRLGDYILLVDSDTRVPKDCLLNAVSELEQSPQVAILQYPSGVMNITTSYFEKGITFFTKLIYIHIKYAVANGDVSPFVGHNAFLRWSAVQQIAWDCEIDDGREKYWSESTVSEDFDLALRLQNEGYMIRLGGYTGDGFKEGVSLTVYDELARWEKYAFGCSELVFHPFRYWPTRGPFTPLIRRFLFSRIPLPSKLTIIAYIGTYFAIASAWLLSLMNFFVMGWFNGHIDKYYINSWQVLLSIFVVFSALGNLSLAAFRFRIGEKNIVASFIENITWIPLLLCFLGGASMHISQAILCHLFSIEITWAATAKELDNTSFFIEVLKLFKKFKFTFIYCILCMAIMVACKYFVPVFWRVDLFIAIYPLGMSVATHFCLPILLNPTLMLFTW